MRFLLQYLEYLVKKLLRYSAREKIVIGNKSRQPSKAGDTMLNSQAVNLSENFETASVIQPPKFSLVKARSEVRSIDIQWLRDFIQEHEIQIDTRDYQERIVVRAINYILVEGATSMMIESATGSGKTIIGLLICKVLQEVLGYNTNWCTMRRNLLTQAGEKDRDMNFNVEPELVSMFDANPKENDVLLVDEAHHDSTTSMANVHSKTRPKIIILLSATPIRADKATIFFQKSIKDSGIRALIRDGWLSQFHHFTIDDWTPEEVAKCYLRSPEKWGKSCVFFHKYEQCLEFQRLLLNAGVESELVTAKTNRDEQLERFENGEIDILINMMILTEGFDCPALETVFVRDSYKGTTIQMGGRVLRLYEGMVKNIVQSKQTPYPFTRLASAKAKFLWEEETQSWKELGTNPLIDKIVADSLQQLAAHACDETARPTKLIEHLKKKKLHRSRR